MFGYLYTDLKTGSLHVLHPWRMPTIDGTESNNSWHVKEI